MSAPSAGWSTKPVPAWAVPIEAPPATATAAAPENGTRYLVLDRQIRVGATVETSAHVAQHVTNEAGLAASSQVVIGFDPSYQSVALHYVRVRRGSDVLDRLDTKAIKVVQR